MKTLDISGFGGGYEGACQQMLTNGLAYVVKKGMVDPKYHAFENIHGLCTAENDDAKALDAAILKDVDATGAMHHSVISHLLYILKHGYEKWLDQGLDRQIDITDPRREEALKSLVRE